MKRLGKLAGILLAMALFCVLMVTTVCAEGEITVTTANELNSAISDNSCEVITLNADIEISKRLVFGSDVSRNLTLNMNGHQLTADTGSSLLYLDGFSQALTISGNGTISIESAGASCITMNSGTLIIENGSFYGTMSAIMFNSGNLTINAGTFTSDTSDESVSTTIAVYGGSLTVNEGRFLSGTSCALYCNSEDAAVTLKGGTYVAQYGADAIGTINKYKPLTSFLAAGYNYYDTGDNLVSVGSDDLSIRKTVTVHSCTHSFGAWANGERTCSICGTVEKCTHAYDTSAACTICGIAKPVPVVIKYDDISSYRSEKPYTNYPVKDGYVFAGWYTDEECTTPIERTKTEGEAWARFVDSAVLTVRWQVSSGTSEAAASGGTTNLRILTSVDSLDYSKVGFDVSIGDVVINDLVSSTVFTKIYAFVDDTAQTILPSVFCTSSKYFMPYIITNIPSTYFEQSIVVTPKWTTLDGTYVTGTVHTFTISEDYTA